MYTKISKKSPWQVILSVDKQKDIAGSELLE